MIMLGSATVALTALRGQQRPAAPAEPRAADAPLRGFTVIDGGRTAAARRPPPHRATTSGSFMERMEERWRRRRERAGGF